MITKKTALKIVLAFVLYYTLLFLACGLHAQTGDVIQMRFEEGIIEAGNVSEHRIYIKYTPHGGSNYTDKDSITVNTYRFCPEKYDITEKFGTTIWLSAAGDMRYTDFLREYMQENTSDAKMIWKHAADISAGLDAHFPATIIRQMRKAVKVRNKNINKF